MKFSWNCVYLSAWKTPGILKVLPCVVLLPPPPQTASSHQSMRPINLWVHHRTLTTEKCPILSPRHNLNGTLTLDQCLFIGALPFPAIEYVELVFRNISPTPHQVESSAYHQPSIIEVVNFRNSPNLQTLTVDWKQRLFPVHLNNGFLPPNFPGEIPTYFFVPNRFGKTLPQSWRDPSLIILPPGVWKNPKNPPEAPTLPIFLQLFTKLGGQLPLTLFFFGGGEVKREKSSFFIVDG